MKRLTASSAEGEVLRGTDASALEAHGVGGGADVAHGAGSVQGAGVTRRNYKQRKMEFKS